MKKIKYILGALMVTIIASQSCTSNFEKINKNPNATTEVPTPFILSYTQRQVAYFVSDSWRDIRQSGVASQIWAQRNYTSEDRYQFRRETSDGYFRNTYIYMTGYTDIINLNNDDATKGSMSAYGDNAMQIATATLLRIWGVQLLAESFGDVPYSEAFQAPVILLPKYDEQSKLFPQLIDDVNTAISQLKSSTKGWTEGDLIYGGNISQWLKFANTLKLRLALRISNVYSGWEAVAKEAIADGVLASNDDNAGIQFTAPGSPNEAPIYNAFVSRNDFTLTQQFLGLLQGVSNSDINFTNPFEGLRDPRLDVYVGSANKEAGRFMGLPYGMPDATNGQYVGDNSATLVNLRVSPRPQIAAADFYVRMLDYPTTCYMVSEVNGWSASDFENGLNASMEMWGAENYSDYVSEVMTRFNAATTEAKKEIVLTQKYMHLLTQSFEAWSEYRRTGYPKSLVLPGQITAFVPSESGLLSPVYFNTLSETGGIIVPRLLYDSNEYSLNQANVEAAAANIGGDTYSTVLWWAKATQRNK